MIEGYRQFLSHFGGFIAGGYLAYSVKAYFDNGGKRCWIVRVASRAADVGAQAAELRGPLSAPWAITAATPGAWANELAVRVDIERFSGTAVVAAASTESFLAVASVAGYERGSLVELARADAGPASYGVVDHVDAVQSRLYWRPQTTAAPGLPYGVPGPLPGGVALTAHQLFNRVSVYRRQRLLAQHRQLAPAPEHPRYAARVLAAPDYSSVVVERRVPDAAWVTVAHRQPGSAALPQPMAPTLDSLGAPAAVALQGGADGLAALTPDDFIGLAGNATARGIAALAAVAEVSVLAAPDAVFEPRPPVRFEPEPPPVVDPCAPCPPDVEPAAAARVPAEQPPGFGADQIYRIQQSLISHCEALCDRFAILDAPLFASREESQRLSAILAWRDRF